VLAGEGKALHGHCQSKQPTHCFRAELNYVTG